MTVTYTTVCDDSLSPHGPLVEGVHARQTVVGERGEAGSVCVV